MCYECGDVFHNIENLPAFEEFGLEHKRNYSFEFEPDGIKRVHRSELAAHEHHGHHANHSVHDSHGMAPHTHRSTNHHHDTQHGHPFMDGGTHAPETETVPEPRYPTIEIEGDEDLLEAARELVNKRKLSWQASGSSDLELGARPGAGYDMDSGEFERVLMVVESNYDQSVPKAIADAMRETSAEVDIVSIQKVTGEIDPWEHELPGVHTGLPWGHPLLNMKEVRWWEDLAEESDTYDLLVYGVGGPNRILENTEYQRIPWRLEEDLVSPANTFPTPVWELINEKTAEIVKEAKEVRLTDPEGTDLKFTNYDDDGIYFNRDAPGHIFGHPSFITPEADTTGVIAGTVNHAGAFPRIEVELKDAKVVDIREGGRYGQMWREMLDETEGIQYPGLPGPGLFWLWEMAIGTHPKVSRPPAEDITRVQYPEIERRRSGIIHCGFGIQYQIEPYAAKLDGIPWGHVHVHLNFATYEATMPDGETTTLIDDGHLTTLDHPEVREKATEYGDPDDLLTEDWIPAVPGINTGGDYQDDYANNPADWIKREMEEQARK